MPFKTVSHILNIVFCITIFLLSFIYFISVYLHEKRSMAYIDKINSLKEENELAIHLIKEYHQTLKDSVELNKQMKEYLKLYGVKIDTDITTCE